MPNHEKVRENSVMRFHYGLFVALILCFTVSCQKQVQTKAEVAWQPPTKQELQQQYLAAIKDAAQPAEADDIYRELWNISEGNPNLRWKNIAGEAHLLIATWTSWDGYDSKVGQTMELSRETWITLVPQMQAFCRAYRGPLDLETRLEQLIGLPIDAGKTKVVQMWARPEDLFRPCADPGIVDFECQGNFSQSAYVTIAPEYIAWFEQLEKDSYTDDGYPWTRLGYTYDWNSETPKFGLSEYIVRANSMVWIDSVAATADYCN
jgi:hypothetical protein